MLPQSSGSGQSEFHAVTCCECGIRFAMQANHYDQRRRDAESFYCPNGHEQHFPKPKVDDDRLRSLHRIDQLEAQVEELQSRLSSQGAEPAKADEPRNPYYDPDADLYRCPHCDKVYRQGVRLGTHLRKVHQVEPWTGWADAPKLAGKGKQPSGNGKG